MMMQLSPQKRMQGLSIVEIMIALTLGSFLSIGVVQLYISDRSSHRLTDGVSQIQDNVRFAQDLLVNNIRMAGYKGCMTRGTRMSFENLLNNGTNLSFSFDEALRGYDDVSASLPVELAAALAGDPKPTPGTDVLIVKGATSTGVKMLIDPDGPLPANKDIELTEIEPAACPDGGNRVSGLCKNDIVMAADCDSAVIFQVTNLTPQPAKGVVNLVHAASGTPGNRISSWGGKGVKVKPAYRLSPDNTELIKMETNIYYIADNSGRPALYRKTNGAAAQIVGDNIADMQVTYGVYVNGSLDGNVRVTSYDRAGDVTATGRWNRVVSAKIELLAASDDDHLADRPMTLTFSGETYEAEDRRLYQVANTTSTIRNMAP